MFESLNPQPQWYSLRYIFSVDTPQDEKEDESLLMTVHRAEQEYLRRQYRDRNYDRIMGRECNPVKTLFACCEHTLAFAYNNRIPSSSGIVMLLTQTDVFLGSIHLLTRLIQQYLTSLG